MRTDTFTAERGAMEREIGETLCRMIQACNFQTIDEVRSFVRQMEVAPRSKPEDLESFAQAVWTVARKHR